MGTVKGCGIAALPDRGLYQGTKHCVPGQRRLSRQATLFKES